MSKKSDKNNKQDKSSDYTYDTVMRNVFGQGEEKTETFKIPSWLLYVIAYAVPLAALTRGKSDYAEMMFALLGGIVLGSLVILSYNLANRANLYFDIQNPLESYLKYKQYNKEVKLSTIESSQKQEEQEQSLNDLFGPNVIERERPEEPDDDTPNKKKGFFRKKKK